MHRAYAYGSISQTQISLARHGDGDDGAIRISSVQPQIQSGTFYSIVVVVVGVIVFGCTTKNVLADRFESKSDETIAHTTL